MEASNGAENSRGWISIRGARTHNLKNIDLDIPRGKFVVITGPSGSGKSSLALDTLFAEGQRQYVESLAVSARHFLPQWEQADVDQIEGLPPTLCIDQHTGGQHPRSTVATVTEIYDYLRVLFARLGNASCHQCGAPIRQHAPEKIHDAILRLPEESKLMLLAPLVRNKPGRHEEAFAKIRKAGYVRVRIDGRILELEETPVLAEEEKHTIEAVVDRLVIRPGGESRLADSIHQALRLSGGLLTACWKAPAEDEPWRDDLFSTHYACPRCDVKFAELEPRTFSFNSPYGACPACTGLGWLESFDPELVLNPRLSLSKGAVTAWKSLKKNAASAREKELEPLLEKLGIDRKQPLAELPEGSLTELLHCGEQENPGLLILLEQERATCTSEARLDELESLRGRVVCPECRGSRLRIEARSVTLGGKAIHEVTALAAAEAKTFFESLVFEEHQQPVAEPLIAAIGNRLEYMEKAGLPYLSLDRGTQSLSGGEMQRVRLATCIGSGLVGVCYVLDEPSIGLHPRDNQRLIDALRDLQKLGNTVLVVEHDEAMMRQADQLVDIGPGAGAEGGRVMFQSEPNLLPTEGSITADYLAGRRKIEIPARRRPAGKTNALILEEAATHNLRQVTVHFPLEAFVCVTGVSGSGKSSLVNETLAPALIRKLGGVAPRPGPHKSLKGASRIEKLVRIDQSPIGRTPRSNPATYTGAFDEIRKIFAGARIAKQRGYRVGRFSPNNKSGRCETCQGQGVKKIEMKLLPNLYVTCESCGGARFNAATLAVQFHGKSIADVLALPISAAAEFFTNIEAVQRPLRSLCDVGLGYLPLGHPATDLSGGEAQRVKLAAQLARTDTGKTLYLLDEPTTGLHFEDVRRLLGVLHQLVDRGNSVIVIEHHTDVIKTADWVIDLGPDGGSGGGTLVAAGTPEEVAQVAASHTGRFLKE